MKEQNPIDQYFREQLQDAEVKPSADLWSKMEPRMEDRRASRRGWFIGIAASFALAFTVTSWMYDSYQNHPGDNGIVTDPDPIENVTPTLEDNIEEPSESIEVESLEAETIDASSIANETQRLSTPSIRPQRIIGHDAGESARAYNALNSGSENQTFAMAENQEESTLNGSLNPTTEDNSGVDFDVKIDPYEYLAARRAEREKENAQPEPEKVTLDQYAVNQFNNLIEGKGVEAPKKEEIRWPELSINLSPIIQKFSPLLDNTTTQQ